MTDSSSRRGARSALLAAVLGWTLDAFDFFLVVLCLTAIGAEFHCSDKQMAFSLTLTLAFRPVGAVIFGALADRYGRRRPLIAVLVFYSIVEVLTGLAPGYKSFLLFRALFGIGMGGEWGVGACLAMEHAPPERRGGLSGLLQEGYAAGYLLAAVAFRFVSSHHWGWRPLFFIGGLPAILALYVQWGVPESPTWQKSPKLNWGSWRDGLVGNWKLLLYLTALMAAMNFASHGTQDLYPTFLQRQWKLGPERRSEITALSMLGAIGGGIVFGLISDRFGRRKAMLLAFVLALAVIPLWAFSPRVMLLLGGAILMQFMVQGAWGVIPAHITELSPDSVRGFLPGFAYQLGVLIAGSISFIQADFADRYGYSQTMAVTSGGIFVLALIVIAVGRERHGIAFAQTVSS